MRTTHRSVSIRAALGAAALLGAVLAPASFAAANPSSSSGAWFAAWSRSQNVSVGAAADVLSGGPGPTPLIEQSVRDIARVSASGDQVRVRLSNRFGASPVANSLVPIDVTAASVGLRSKDADVVARTLKPITFGGKRSVSIPAGGYVVSDPVALTVTAGQDLAVSLAVPLAPIAPNHGASFVTSYISSPGSGDHTADASGAAFSKTTASTLVLSAIDVRSRTLRGVIATTGGSVTDGFGTEVDSYSDFPAWLSTRIRKELPANKQKAVVNNGLGGTTASEACNLVVTGPAVETRVQNDSLSLSGVTDLIVYAGTNDLGALPTGCAPEKIIAAFRSIIRQAHAEHVRVLISTITPRAKYSAAVNVQREAVNAWIRKGLNCSGECDRSLDFDVVIRDPKDHNRIDPKLDSGDGIHPTGEGYRRIAASIPLSAL